MSSIIGCPRPTYMASIVTELNPCAVNLAQIQKMVFWRRGGGGTIASAITSAFWTAQLALTTTGKPVVSPFVTGKVTAGDTREFGGGNETKNGIPIPIGNNPTVAEFNVYQADQDTIALLKAIQKEPLDVIFINENGQFYYNDAQTLAFTGFPIDGLSVSDVSGGEFGGVITNKIKFYLAPNWSDSAELSAATTFALTLINT
jgi:hypothetical protein